MEFLAEESKRPLRALPGCGSNRTLKHQSEAILHLIEVDRWWSLQSGSFIISFESEEKIILFDPQDEIEIRNRLSEVTNDVKLILFTQTLNCDTCPQVEQLVKA